MNHAFNLFPGLVLRNYAVRRRLRLTSLGVSQYDSISKPVSSASLIKFLETGGRESSDRQKVDSNRSNVRISRNLMHERIIMDL